MENKKCLNCEQELNDKAVFCHLCGQEVQADANLKSLFSHFLNDYFTFDSKIIRSLRPLITQPGFLTTEFLAGRRVRYIPPFRMFIFLSIIFFLLLGLLNGEEAKQSAEGAMNEHLWERFFDSRLPKLFFLLFPIFALLIALFFRKRKASLLPHFLFSLHFHSSVFFLGILYALLSSILAQFDLIFINQILLLSIGLFLLAYLWKGLKVVYKQKAFTVSWKLFLIGLFYTLILVSSALLLLVLTINY